MEKERITYLLEKQLSDTLSDQERDELVQLLNSDDNAIVLDVISQQIAAGKNAPRNVSDSVMESSFNTVMATDKVHDNGNGQANFIPAQPARLIKRAIFRYAAAVLLIVATGTYLWYHNSQEQSINTTDKLVSSDIPPGKNGAVLTLADGSQIELDSLKEGVIAQQNGSKVLLENGKVYYAAAGENTTEVTYNTMTTPKGRSTQFTLPDGTIVWLNAGSSIEYPTAFSSKERRVRVKGELYFDVVKNVHKPFIVETDNINLEVLGTEFNINCYDNESQLKTTLVTGSVKVSSAKNSSALAVLKPGQQAILNKAQPLPGETAFRVVNVKDINQVIDWKNGLFNFEGADIHQVMRQLERWYNIKVEYSGENQKVKFGGKMYRNINLSDVLMVLKRMDINVELKGDVLYVK